MTTLGIARKTLLSAALLASAFTAASAAQIEFDVLTPLVPVPAGGITLTTQLPKFDPALGTLTGVQLSSLYTGTTSYLISYLPNAPGFANWANIGATSQVTVPQLLQIADLFQPLGFTWTDRTCTEAPCEINAAFTKQFSASALIDAANWGLYTGTGDFDIKIDNLLVRDTFTSGGSFQAAATSTEVAVFARVIYDYRPAPEPGSLALLALAGSALAFTRRRRRA